MVDIDLGELAYAYRHRPTSDAARARAVASASGCAGWLLDIGGGTGDHAAAWVDHGRSPIVVDPSSAMLKRARRQGEVSVVQARSQGLPFDSDVAGLAYFHLSIHYGDWKAAIDEAHRVVRPGGRIEVWTMAPDAIARSSLGRWFPTVVEIDTERFPDPTLIAERCMVAGSAVDVSNSSEPIGRSARNWEEAVRGRFVSTLQLITDEEIEQGLARFTAQYPDSDSIYRYELGLTRISAVVPLR